jgi:hypothetical protein
MLNKEGHSSNSACLKPAPLYAPYAAANVIYSVEECTLACQRYYVKSVCKCYLSLATRSTVGLRPETLCGNLAGEVACERDVHTVMGWFWRS